MKYPNLIAEIKKNKETQAEVAKIIGLSTSMISYLLQGKRRFRIDTIKKICNHYQKPFEYLFVESEENK